MATTDGATALRAVSALKAAGINFAVLHGSEKLTGGGGAVSDIDLVVKRGDVRSVVSAIRGAGLTPLLLWPYDAGALDVFAVDRDFRTGVQIDLMYDQSGAGKYGLRASPVLEHCQDGPAGVPEASAVDRWIYLVRKRTVKGDQQRLDELRAEPPGTPESLAARAKEVLAPRYAAGFPRLLGGQVPERPRRVTSSAEIGRLVRRLIWPIGLWVHLEGRDARDLADDLAASLGAVLLKACVAELGALRLWNRLVLPGPAPRARWRAGVVFTVGARPVGATVVLPEGVDRAGACAAIARVTEARCLRQADLILGA